MSDHYKIAVLGDQDSVLGFKALGLDVFPAETVEEGRETLHRLARESYAIVYLTEQLAQGLAPEILRMGPPAKPRDFVGERRGSRANEPWRLRRGEGCTACPDEKEGRYI